MAYSVENIYIEFKLTYTNVFVYGTCAKTNYIYSVNTKITFTSKEVKNAQKGLILYLKIWEKNVPN